MSLLDRSADSPHVAADRLLQIIQDQFGDGLQAARPATASGPSPDPNDLRQAYLTLLKLCLCDLAGTTTTSVARTIEGAVMSRELADAQLRFRAAGLDWPLHGLTMVGLARLDDLQACVESVVGDGVEGELIEAGSWRGGASMLIRATLNSLGEADRTLWVADSFQGFPSTEATGQDGYDLDADLANCDFLAVPLDEVKANFARFGLSENVNFVPGFFEDTLPALPARRWAVARLDGDSYDATRLGLETLYGNVAEGGYVIIDDYLPLDDCRRAVDDFRRDNDITEPIEPIDWSGARWRKATAPDPLPATPEPAPEGLGTPRLTQRSVPRASVRARIPATEEVALRHELDELRAQLEAARREVDALRGHPLRGPRAWASARLKRGGSA